MFEPSYVGIWAAPPVTSRQPATRPIFALSWTLVEYTSVCWDPHTQKNIKKVEQIQRSSARYVTGNYARTSSVTSMLNDLQWDSLESRRLQSRLNIIIYKIRYGLVAINQRIYLTEVLGQLDHKRSQLKILGPTLQHPSVSPRVYHSSFFPRTSRDWNELSTDPASFASLDCFKSAIGGAQKQVIVSAFFIQHSTCSVYILHTCGYVLYIRARSQPQCVDLHKAEVALLRREKDCLT